MALSDVLHHLINTNKTTASQAGILAKVSSVQTIYNWLSGRGSPTEVGIKGWLSLNAPQALQEATLREITNGRASFTQPASEDEVNLDFNGDGNIDLGDAMAATMKYEEAAHDTLKLIYEAHERDPRSISAEAWQKLLERNGRAVACMKAIDKICSEKVSRRRQAREVCCGVH